MLGEAWEVERGVGVGVGVVVGVCVKRAVDETLIIASPLVWRGRKGGRFQVPNVTLFHHYIFFPSIFTYFFLASSFSLSFTRRSLLLLPQELLCCVAFLSLQSPPPPPPLPPPPSALLFRSKAAIIGILIDLATSYPGVL